MIQFHDYFLGLWLQIVVPDFGKDRVFFMKLRLQPLVVHIYLFLHSFFPF